MMNRSDAAGAAFHTFRSLSLEQTRHTAAQLARVAQPGEIYALVGPLGTGKTEFTRGFVKALDPAAAVRSPSFTLVNVYATPKFPVYHFDFYRIAEASELREIGFAEYAGGGGVCIVEWADMYMEELPAQATRVIRFADIGEQVREITYEFTIDA